MHALIATYRLAGVAAAEHAELCEQLAPSASDFSICDGPTAITHGPVRGLVTA
jgi:hypothetical protein